MNESDTPTYVLLGIVASIWIFMAFGMPKIFPTGKWSDLRRFFRKKRKR